MSQFVRHECAHLSISSYLICNWRFVSSPIQSSAFSFPVGGVNRTPSSFCNNERCFKRKVLIEKRSLYIRFIMISKGIYTWLTTLPTMTAHNEIIMKVSKGWNKKKFRNHESYYFSFIQLSLP